MNEKRKKLISLLLVFSLVTLSGNLLAQEKKGANLRIQKNDGQKVVGELIAVKKDSLLLLDSETEADLSVDIKDVKVITIEKKSWMLELGIGGFLAGAAIRGIIHSSVERDVAEEEATAHQVQSLWAWGAIAGAAGLASGAVLGINQTIQIQGKSDVEIQDALEKLSKKAREPNFQ